VKTCLAKDPQDRWQTASDLLAELEAISEGGEPTAAAPGSAAPRTRASLSTVLGIAAVLSVGLGVPAFLYVRGPAEPDELRFRVPMPLAQTGNSVQAGAFGANAQLNSPDFAVSPDGRLVVVAARTLGANPFFLSVRPVGAVTQQQLSGTEGATQPFWSPDGRWIGFVAGGRLKKVEASGGPPQELCDASDFSGGSWNADGTILYGSSRGLQRVSDQGGTPAPVTTLTESETGHFWPTFLPDGRGYLYLAWSAESSRRAIFSGTLDTNERTKVLAAESNPAYSEPGYLLFARETAVYAQAVDAATLAPEGEPVRVADEVLVDEGNGRGHFSASHNGVLAFFFSADSAAGAGGGLQSDTGMFQLTWVDRTAQPIGTVGTPRPIRGVEVSPDASRVAVHHHEAAGGNIWVVEPRGTETRLTFNASEHNSAPIWSPDGSHIVFAALRNGKWGLYRKVSTPSDTDELLFESDLPKAPMSWSPDGTRLVFWVRDPKTSGDLWVLTMDDRKAAPLLATPFNETHAQISPDGKWLAYTSNSQDRRNEIFVQPFPTSTDRYQVSNNGGDWPRWRKDGQELFYHSIGVVPSPAVSASQPVFVGPLFAAPVRVSGTTLEPGPPAAVMNFRAMKLQHAGGDYSTYAVSPDGQRFLILQWVPPAAGAAGQVGPDVPSGLTIVMQWTAGLKKK
jgi:Tol biopolymer transport system component